MYYLYYLDISYAYINTHTHINESGCRTVLGRQLFQFLQSDSCSPPCLWLNFPTKKPTEKSSPLNRYADQRANWERNITHLPSPRSSSCPTQPLPYQSSNDEGHPSTAAQRFVCLGSRRGASLCRLTHFHNCVFAGREALTLLFFLDGGRWRYIKANGRVGGPRASACIHLSRNWPFFRIFPSSPTPP